MLDPYRSSGNYMSNLVIIYLVQYVSDLPYTHAIVVHSKKQTNSKVMPLAA